MLVLSVYGHVLTSAINDALKALLERVASFVAPRH